MADFTLVAKEQINHTAVVTRDTTSITPAVGDIVFWGANGSAGTDAALSGGGMTWALLGTIETVAGEGFGVAFRAASGTPSAGVLTFTSSDDFADSNYSIVRPVDLTYVGVAGQDSAAAAASLSIALTTSSPAALLAWGFTRLSGGSITFAQDTGWTEIYDQTGVSTGAQQLQELFGDDTACVIDPSSDSDTYGIVLEFDATAAGATRPAGINRGLINNGLINGGLIR